MESAWLGEPHPLARVARWPLGDAVDGWKMPAPGEAAGVLALPKRELLIFHFQFYPQGFWF